MKIDAGRLRDKLKEEISKKDVLCFNEISDIIWKLEKEEIWKLEREEIRKATGVEEFEE